MTPDELDQTIVRLGLQQKTAAEMIGVTAFTVHRWVAGKVRIPVPVSLLFRLISRYKVTPEAIEKLKRLD